MDCFVGTEGPKKRRNWVLEVVITIGFAAVIGIGLWLMDHKKDSDPTDYDSVKHDKAIEFVLGSYAGTMPRTTLTIPLPKGWSMRRYRYRGPSEQATVMDEYEAPVMDVWSAYCYNAQKETLKEYEVIRRESAAKNKEDVVFGKKNLSGMTVFTERGFRDAQLYNYQTPIDRSDQKVAYSKYVMRVNGCLILVSFSYPVKVQEKCEALADQLMGRIVFGL